MENSALTIPFYRLAIAFIPVLIVIGILTKWSLQAKNALLCNFQNVRPIAHYWLLANLHLSNQSILAGHCRTFYDGFFLGLDRIKNDKRTKTFPASKSVPCHFNRRWIYTSCHFSRRSQFTALVHATVFYTLSRNGIRQRDEQHQFSSRPFQIRNGNRGAL